MMADVFQARGYAIVSGCGSGGPEDGQDAKGAESASYLVCESEGHRTAVLCCLEETAWSVDWLTRCCKCVGASSGMPVLDVAPPASLDAQREGGPELEFWGMDRVVAEMQERLSW